MLLQYIRTRHNLVMEVIHSGKLVTEVTMYEIVVASDKAKLLKLLMNTKENMCEFKSVASHCKFTSLLNMHDIRRNVKGKEKKH